MSIPDTSALSADPIFIVGTPRSGTTLTSSILSAHPEITISGETHLLSRWMRSHVARPDLTKAEFERAWERYIATSRFKFLNLDAAAIAARVHASGNYHVATVLAAILAEQGASRGKPRAGEKTPAHDRYMHTLLSWYPDARIIYLLRDPRAVVASLVRTPWGCMISPDEHAQRWAESFRNRMTLKDDPRVTTVQYEELVSAPEAVVRGICAFLGAEFRSDMIGQREVSPQDMAMRTGWAKQHFSTVLAPLSTAAIDAWRERTTPEETAIIEYFCGTAMTDAGYEPSPRRATRLDLAEAWTRRQTMRVRRRIKRAFEVRSGPLSDQEPGIGG